MTSAFPAVPTLQCVNALLTLGFAIADFDDRSVTLFAADGRRVVVRRHCTLSPSELRAILIVAAIPLEAFIAAVAKRGSQVSCVDPPNAQSGIRDRDGTFAEVEEIMKRRGG